MRKVLADLLISFVTLAALGSIVYGSWLIFRPAAWVVGGVLLLLLANGMQRGAKKR